MKDTLGQSNLDSVQVRPVRKVQRGIPSNDLVLTAYSDGNDKLFPRILDLYVQPQSVVADVTFGKGVFWRNVPDGRYDL